MGTTESAAAASSVVVEVSANRLRGEAHQKSASARRHSPVFHLAVAGHGVFSDHDFLLNQGWDRLLIRVEVG